MKSSVPLFKLPNTAQTAAIIRDILGTGPQAPPEVWATLSEDHGPTILGRAVFKVVSQVWYDWYLKNPIITAGDIAQAHDDVAQRGYLWPSFAVSILKLAETGYKPLVKEVFAVRKNLMGSSIAFFRDYENTHPGAQDDISTCVYYLRENLHEDGKPFLGTFMWGGVEPADFYVSSLARVIFAVHEQKNRWILPSEFNVASTAISKFIMECATDIKLASMRKMLFQEMTDNPLDLTWENDRLIGVKPNAPSDDFFDGHPKTKQYLKDISEVPIRTGCPAVFARASEVGVASNPVAAMISWYAKAAEKGLFCPASGLTNQVKEKHVVKGPV